MSPIAPMSVTGRTVAGRGPAPDRDPAPGQPPGRDSTASAGEEASLLTELRTASDYKGTPIAKSPIGDPNRGLAVPVRWGHIAWARLSASPRALYRWTMADGGRTWARIALVGLLAVLVLLPFDAPMERRTHRLDALLYGDANRVLHWLQEYGQGPSVVLVVVLIWQLDPRRRRDLLYWLGAIAACWVLTFAAKVIVGRVRPKFDEPFMFLGPFGEYPIGPGLGVHHAWEFWTPAVSDTSALWSMPSSHTAFAVLMSCFLARLYPPIRALVIALAVLVALCRVLYGSHYPSDVAAGAFIGLIAWRLVMPRSPDSEVRASRRPAPWPDVSGAPV